MATLAGAVTSARLTLKVHRFEVLAVSVAALVVAASALIVTYRLNAVGVTTHCLVAWLTSGPDSVGACADPVSRWASINEDEAGKIAAAMALLPWAIGLLVGVPLVGRELEARTAAMAWSLSGSRRRWLAGRLGPVLLLVLGLSVVGGVAMAILETARSGDGVWHNLYQDAELFGAPVVAHALAGLGIGVLVGALMGRTLPALIVGGLVAIVLFNVGQIEHQAYLPAPVFDSPNVTAVPVGGGSNPDDVKLVMDPDLDYRFQTSDGQLLTREAALATVPAGTTDVAAWLVTHYALIFEGPSTALTSSWQLAETVGFGGLAIVLLLLSFPVVERARPT